MVDYIVCSEFHDTEGKIVRCSTPTNILDDMLEVNMVPPGSKPEHPLQKRRAVLQDRICEFMIPFCGKDRMIDCTFFEVNRPKMSQMSQGVRSLVKTKKSMHEKIMTPKRLQNLESILNQRWPVKCFRINDLEW